MELGTGRWILDSCFVCRTATHSGTTDTGRYDILEFSPAISKREKHSLGQIMHRTLWLLKSYLRCQTLGLSQSIKSDIWLFLVLFYKWRTDNMWGACGEPVGSLWGQSQHSPHILTTNCPVPQNIVIFPIRWVLIKSGKGVDRVWERCW